jgi:methyl-accepting chemotaxis protein
MKLIILSCISILLTSICSYFTAYYYIQKGLNTKFKENIEYAQLTVSDIIQTKIEKYKSIAKLLQTNEELGADIYLDLPLDKYGKVLNDTIHASYITITNNDGIVLYRYHDSAVGDKLSEIAPALDGKLYTYTSKGDYSNLAIKITGPLYSEGKIVGTITIGEILDSEQLVDHIKEITGYDVTIFDNRTRLMTTIKQNNQRVIGTQLTDPEVLRSLFTNKMLFLKKVKVLDIPYLTAYWPILNQQGKTIGSYFIGKSVAAIDELIHTVSISILLIVGIVSIVLIIVVIYLSSKISRPLKSIKDYAETIATGESCDKLEITTKDELEDLNEAIGTMVDMLIEKINESDRAQEVAKQETQKAIEATKVAEEAKIKAENAKREGMLQATNQLQDIVDILSSASEELSVQIEQSAQGAKSQSDRTTDTATAMEEMSKTTIEIASNTSNVFNVSNQTSDEAKSGTEAVVKVMDDMDHVQNMTEVLTTEMYTLKENSTKINKILEIINDIVDQINLLSLNAAIESARAGEAGRGFAVVSDEIRKLAEKTINATGDIEKVILDVQKAVDDNVSNVSTITTAVTKAKEDTNVANGVLTSIVNMAEDVTIQVQSISTACEEQSAVSNEISETINAISEIGTETSTAMNESSLAINELSQQAQKLKQLIDQLRSDNSQTYRKRDLYPSSY